MLLAFIIVLSHIIFSENYVLLVSFDGFRYDYTENIDTPNFDKIQKYVEQPNELDKQVKSLQKTVNKYGKYIEDVEKNIAILKKVAHPKADFVCTDCGTKAKRVKDKVNKLKEKFK